MGDRNYHHPLSFVLAVGWISPGAAPDTSFPVNLVYLEGIWEALGREWTSAIENESQKRMHYEAGDHRSTWSLISMGSVGTSAELTLEHPLLQGMRELWNLYPKSHWSLGEGCSWRVIPAITSAGSQRKPWGK